MTGQELIARRSALNLTPPQLAERLGRADAPLLLDVRRQARFDQSGRMLAGAVRCALRR